MNKGKIKQIIGSVLDIEFENGELPEIYNALEIETNVSGKKETIIAEVQTHIGGKAVRAIALSSTDGLIRGQEVSNTGKPISVQIGRAHV